MISNVDPKLFWQLPTPSTFVKTIASSLQSKRGIFINVPEYLKPLIDAGIRYGLEYTNQHEDPVFLSIQEGSNISVDIGYHFSKERVTASQLALYKTEIGKAFILVPESEKAQSICEQYAKEFIKASSNAEGVVQLIVKIHDETLLENTSNRHFEVIPFDGALKPDEIEAYVSLRMINRQGPDSTRLYRSIISEFSGFDCQLAERLISLSNEQIINIREVIPSLMSDDIQRWRHDSWLNGTYAISSEVNHTMRDVYLMKHGNDTEKSSAKKAIDKLFWRACLKEVTPWLEEKRSFVLKPLMTHLKKLSVNDKFSVPAGNNVKLVDIHELEYGNVSWFIGSNKIKLQTRNERNALFSCHAAKKIRDEISHLRAPTVDMIDEVFKLIGDL